MIATIERSGKVVKICLGVSAYKRPIMLLRSLTSVKDTEIPAGHQLDCVIAGHEVDPASRNIICRFQENIDADRFYGPAFHYVHNAQDNIPCAQNSILDFATAQGADWIAMLDNDQAVPPNWLRQMIATQKETSAEAGIVSGLPFQLEGPGSRACTLSGGSEATSKLTVGRQVYTLRPQDLGQYTAIRGFAGDGPLAVVPS